MHVIIDLYSEKETEIKRFLSKIYPDINLPNKLFWTKDFENPTQATELIGLFIDNKENFSLNMWVSFDKDFFINVTDYNSDKIIRYLFERYPY